MSSVNQDKADKSIGRVLKDLGGAILEQLVLIDDRLGLRGDRYLEDIGASARRCNHDGEVVHLPWRRPVALVMRGWQPRAAEPRRSLTKRIAAAVAAFFHRLADD